MNSPSFKEDIRKYYNDEAAVRDGKSKKPEWKAKIREDFRNLVISEGKNTLLELGAGAGYDSLFFSEGGLHVTAVDISAEMVKRCRDKGIDARELDFYNLAALDATFDAIYAINTLLHVPKADLPVVLRSIDGVLAENGLFYMGLYGGADTETSFRIEEISDAPRYFVFNSADYLRDLLPQFFDIVSFETLEVGDEGDKSMFHSITLRKKKK